VEAPPAEEEEEEEEGKPKLPPESEDDEDLLDGPALNRPTLVDALMDGYDGR
jgi:hypothetical protein